MWKIVRTFFIISRTSFISIFTKGVCNPVPVGVDPGSCLTMHPARGGYDAMLINTTWQQISKMERWEGSTLLKLNLYRYTFWGRVINLLCTCIHTGGKKGLSFRMKYVHNWVKEFYYCWTKNSWKGLLHFSTYQLNRFKYCL